jgi:hypothetical protein
MPTGFVKVFQYGSNMNPLRLNAPQRLNGKARSVGVARLEGWGVRFDLYSETNKCGVTDIVEAPGEFVLGVLYEVPISLVSPRAGARSRMDKIEGTNFEGTGNYRRQRVRVIVGARPVYAVTYVGTTFGRRRFVSKPIAKKQVSQEYFGNIEAGAKAFRLSKGYRAYLREKAGPLRENLTPD